MYGIVYKIYFCVKRLEKKYKTSRIIKKMLGYIEWYYNILVVKYYKMISSKHSGITKKTRNKRIIVSLTSYPKRIDTIWITIETIMRQSVKPDKIILWLAESQFDGIEGLPQTLKKLMDRGLEIEFCDDLRSHKKYFYVMQKYPDDIVILFDDDMFYPYDTIKKLYKMHKKYPRNICCMTGQVMQTVNGENKPSVWRNPLPNENIKDIDNLQIFTGSGSLYPPHCISKETFDKTNVFKLCPYADDLWLTMMAQMVDTKVTAISPWRAFPITIYGTAEGSLWYINGQNNENDKQWLEMIEYFNSNNKYNKETNNEI